MKKVFICVSILCFGFSIGCSKESTKPKPGLIHLANRTLMLAPGSFKSIEGKQEHVFARFIKLPKSKQIKAMKSMGVLLHQYHKQNTYAATIPAKAVSTLQQKYGLIAIEKIQPEDRLSPTLYKKDFKPWALTKEGLLQTKVYFYPDVLFLEAKQALEGIGIKVQVHKYGYNNRVPLIIESSLIFEIAKLNGVRMIEQKHAPNQNDNDHAAELSEVDTLDEQPYNLTGDGIKVGVWDGGEVDDSHPDFDNRVFVQDNNGISDHATHVAGTIGATGDNDPTQGQNARGMAPEVTIYSFDYFDSGFLGTDEPEDEKDEAFGTNPNNGGLSLQIDNNSWGRTIGWDKDDMGNPVFNNNQNLFGTYDSITQEWDQLAVDFPHVVIVKSAGNDRNDVSGNGGVNPHDGTQNANDNEYYDLIGHKGSAKNVITVGSVEDDQVDNTFPTSDFSSWGPTNDGRIKPDVVANGRTVHSTMPLPNNYQPGDPLNDAYDEKSGTSMATPVVSGTAALLYQQYLKTYHQNPTSAEIKALLIHTALDVDGTPGPSYSHGYGLIKGLTAIEKIRADGANHTHIRTATVENEESVYFSFEIAPNNNKPIQVTLVWTDLPGVANSFNDDIENDLDITVVQTDDPETLYYPWKLDDGVNNRHLAATNNSKNFVDNVEKVEIGLNNPQGIAAGTWSVRVRGAEVANGGQQFAIVFSHPSTDGNLFTDVAPNHWFFPFVESLVENNVIQGHADGSFRPGDPVTRAELVKMLVTATAQECDGFFGGCDDLPYDDVNDDNDDHWAYDFIEIAFDAGWIVHDEDNPNFRPNDPINRAEAAQLLMRATHQLGPCPQPNPFADVSVDDWFYTPTCIAKSQGWFDGYDAGTEPCATVQAGEVHYCSGHNLNRAEAAKIIHQAFFE